ncbi:MAG TPA: hypothetical protein VMK12_23845 [Anaeromyxobacteraceae bacterium]|nr:hypothetical protein [Anaeromyxobacteraceae bacterium]
MSPIATGTRSSITPYGDLLFDGLLPGNDDVRQVVRWQRCAR